MVTTLFFMWGFLTSLNDILIPHLKSIFELNYAKAMLIQFAFFTSYFVFSLPSGKLIDAVGFQKAMVAGLFTMGAGALLFIPAASVPSFPLFLTALIVLAAGMTILQVSANPYVAILGPEKTAASRLNLAQAFNSLGTTIGPKLGAAHCCRSPPAVPRRLAGLSHSRGCFGEVAVSGLRARADGPRRGHRAVPSSAHRQRRAAGRPCTRLDLAP
jgi:FHS family L-fucose permease-like MFS transporter